MSHKPRTGPTPVGQRLRAQTIPSKRHEGPSVDEWLFEGWDDLKQTDQCPHCRGTGSAPGEGDTECGFCEETIVECRNCDKPMSSGTYCSNRCEDMDRFPAPRDDMERLTAMEGA